MMDGQSSEARGGKWYHWESLSLFWDWVPSAGILSACLHNSTNADNQIITDYGYDAPAPVRKVEGMLRVYEFQLSLPFSLPAKHLKHCGKYPFSATFA